MQNVTEQRFAKIDNFPPIAEELFWMVILACPKAGAILELGSGYTTGMFAQHRTIYSVENDADYVGKYNDTQYYIPASIQDGYYNQYVLQGLPKYDVLLIDGPAHDTRIDRFIENMQHFDKTAHWFIDDISHPPFRDGLATLQGLRNKEMITFDTCYKPFGVIMGD